MVRYRFDWLVILRYYGLYAEPLDVRLGRGRKLPTVANSLLSVRSRVVGFYVCELVHQKSEFAPEKETERASSKLDLARFFLGLLGRHFGGGDCEAV